MKPFTIKDILGAVSEGRLETGDRQNQSRLMGRVITGVSTDTRTLERGDLFVALQGETDGHRYVEKALEKGCAAVLISNPQACPREIPAVIVEDTLKALQQLAAWYLSRFSLKKIAVTGSTGKTTTKEMLYALLSTTYQTMKNKGNYNNHIGLPLTAFTVEDRHEMGIFEMGMSGLGEIHLMADILRPCGAIITNVGLSHIQRLGSRENILAAKLEVADFFQKDAFLVINDDNDLLHRAFQEEKPYRVIPVGSGEGLDFRILSVTAEKNEGIRLSMSLSGRTEIFDIPLPGVHNGYNAAEAIAAAVYLGVSPQACRRALENFHNTDKRLAMLEAPGDVRIIDDTYNASPDSMKAALSVLKQAEGSRKIAVLGDMFEMGQLAVDFHRQVGQFAAKEGVDILLTTGENALWIRQGAENFMKQEYCRHFADKTELTEALLALLKPGDVVLVKGSRGMHMEEIVASIQKR